MISKPKIFDYYILIYKPRHPRAVSAGYVPEQILIAEKYLNRPLAPDEDVRHINGNAHDNRLQNLEITSSNSGYKSKTLGLSLDDEEFTQKRNTKTFVSCKFQRQCWKEIRAPIARKNRVYLPYICSFQSEGDIYKCSHFWKFLEKEKHSKGDKI